MGSLRKLTKVLLIAAKSMEADERFRWLETRVSSSLRPRGEDLRRMTVDEDNR